ncbi:unnamed protein product [Caretta caretta]
MAREQGSWLCTAAPPGWVRQCPQTLGWGPHAGDQLKPTFWAVAFRCSSQGPTRGASGHALQWSLEPRTEIVLELQSCPTQERLSAALLRVKSVLGHGGQLSPRGDQVWAKAFSAV